MTLTPLGPQPLGVDHVELGLDVDGRWPVDAHLGHDHPGPPRPGDLVAQLHVGTALEVEIGKRAAVVGPELVDGETAAHIALGVGAQQLHSNDVASLARGHGHELVEETILVVRGGEHAAELHEVPPPGRAIGDEAVDARYGEAAGVAVEGEERRGVGRVPLEHARGLDVGVLRPRR